jgi:cytochrome c
MLSFFTNPGGVFEMFKKVLATLFMLFTTSTICAAAEMVGIGGKCLDVQGGSSADGTPVILWSCHGRENQRWEVSNGAIKGNGGKCLDVKGGVAADGTSVILWPCHGGENQRWEVINGAIKGIGGKCLDVKGGGAADGSSIILWSCHGKENQRWVIR